MEVGVQVGVDMSVDLAIVVELLDLATIGIIRSSFVYFSSSLRSTDCRLPYPIDALLFQGVSHFVAPSHSLPFSVNL